MGKPPPHPGKLLLVRNRVNYACKVTPRIKRVSKRPFLRFAPHGLRCDAETADARGRTFGNASKLVLGPFRPVWRTKVSISTRNRRYLGMHREIGTQVCGLRENDKNSPEVRLEQLYYVWHCFKASCTCVRHSDESMRPHSSEEVTNGNFAQKSAEHEHVCDKVPIET